MDNQDFLSEELIGTIQSLRRMVELEEYFVRDFLVPENPGRDKAVQLELLRRETADCRLCSLHQSRTKVVFGEGNPDAEIMFVGEAPGRDEDLAGRPFVGTAGVLLTKIIQAMGLRREDVFISNVLRCRPPGNRNPLPEEVSCCRPYLFSLLRVIKPKVICTLGKFAAHALLNETRPITKIRGNFFECEGVKVMPTFHPAYLLRNPEDKKLVWQDLQKIMKFLKGRL